jgi:hypothetical protein
LEREIRNIYSYIRKGKGDEDSDLMPKNTVDSLISKFSEYMKKVWG